MNQTIKLGTLRGIPIGANWTVLFVAAILGVTMSQGLTSVIDDGSERWAPVVTVFLVAAFLASIVAHEIGHAVVAQRCGVEVDRITLWILGGVAELSAPLRSARAEVAVAAAGPAVSLGLGVAFAFAGAGAVLAGAGDVIVYAVGWLAAINIVLAVFNMAPGVPLDGGRVLSGVIWWISGRRVTGDHVAAVSGRVIGWALIGFGLWRISSAGVAAGVWSILLGAFLAQAAAAELVRVHARRSAGDLTVGDVMARRDSAVRGWMTVAALRRDGGINDVDFVRAFDGTITGTITASALAGVDDSDAETTTVDTLATPLAATGAMHIDVSVDNFIVQHGLPLEPIPVIDGTRLVGLVDGRHLAHELEIRNALGVAS